MVSWCARAWLAPNDSQKPAGAVPVRRPPQLARHPQNDPWLGVTSTGCAVKPAVLACSSSDGNPRSYRAMMRWWLGIAVNRQDLQ